MVSVTFILVCGCGGDKINNIMSALDETLMGTSLPETPFADSTLGIGNASGVAVHPDGRVFVSSLYGKDDLHFYGKILVLRDDDGDGIADRSTGPDGPAADAYREEFERTAEYTPDVPEELNHKRCGGSTPRVGLTGGNSG